MIAYCEDSAGLFPFLDADLGFFVLEEATKEDKFQEINHIRNWLDMIFLTVLGLNKKKITQAFTKWLYTVLYAPLCRDL